MNFAGPIRVAVINRMASGEVFARRFAVVVEGGRLYNGQQVIAAIVGRFQQSCHRPVIARTLSAANRRF